MHGGRLTLGGSDRGQLGFDFMVGMAVFLLTLGFLFAFLPGMFEPFSNSSGQGMITADRSAARLAEDLLVEDGTDPNVLNKTCTVDFYEEGGTDAAGCRFETDSSDLAGALGIDVDTSVNTTIESGGTIDSLDGVELKAGPVVAERVDVTVSQRIVLLDGQDRRLIVRVW